MLVVSEAGHRAREAFTVPGAGATTEYAPERLDRRLAVAIGLGAILGLTLLVRLLRRKSHAS